jgi:predicted RNase H-like nuclease
MTTSALAGPPVVFVGFDSAWTDKPKAPGAICSTTYEDGRFTAFEPPQLASFAQALAFIQSVRGAGPTLVAVDQPTIVPNATGMRPVDRTAASLVSWLGGGVQAANRGKIGMFDDAAPIWPFLAALNGTENPERARTANEGPFYFEVFPALAAPHPLLSLRRA